MTRAASLPAAIELLNRLRGAAPPATAEKLEQIMALIQNLAQEVAFFNAQIIEDAGPLAAPRAPTAPPPATPAEAAPGDTPVIDEDSALHLLIGLNEGLRAPLIAIRGRAELIRSGLLGQLTAEQAQWLDSIHHNTDRSFRLLDSVQRLIELQQGHLLLDWSDFVASDLLEEALSRVENRAAKRGQTLSMHIPDSVPLAHGDYYQALVVLLELLDNAIRYTPTGGAIRLSVESLGTHVLFSVADTGIGLRPEDLDRVGTLFWRGEYHPLVHQHPGTGLSLVVARQLLKLQGGELIFYGEPDVGSTFSFTLPVPA
jgi:signal transduction histidine kinase